MNKRVLIGISGGVDSAVSAILLKEQGYEVIGITMELFDSNEFLASTDAKKICNYLNIEHYTIDLKDKFYNHVIKDFCNCYSNCKTPNPCIECNRHLKFGAIYEKAQDLNCDYISTGHYAYSEFSSKYNKFVLRKSKSIRKDQSYVLWNIPSSIISKVLFPLSEFEHKEQIRDIARKHGLEVANKPDSEDICFIPDGNYKKFLETKANFKPKEGNIINNKGEVLGKHTGLYKYTIGQRKGLGISNTVPLFVLGFNIAKNELIVGEESELYKDQIQVDNLNLLLFDSIDEWLDVTVKTRYSSKESRAKIKQYGSNIRVIFNEPQRAITPGQSAVFYIDDIVLGGGKIV